VPPVSAVRPCGGAHRLPAFAGRRAASLVAALLAAALLSACELASPASVTPAAVSVFPIPGSRLAAPQTQITFRGTPIQRLGTVSVIGSRTGRHRGRLEPDSDGQGGSFLPDRPFAPGERVTVRTRAPLAGHAGRTFSFVVATPAAAIKALPAAPAARVPGDLDVFRSRPDLRAPAVTVTRPAVGAGAGAGDLFVANQNGPSGSGPMIVDPSGQLVWFHPLPPGLEAADFRVQTYGGLPVLTWWQGGLGAGVGIGLGEDMIFDTSYRRVAEVRAGNGLSADLHEFQLTPQGTALITAYYPVYWDMSAVHGPRRGVVLDAVVQEIDVRTGLVMFQWDSLDHVPLRDSEVPLPSSARAPFDYFHVNSVEQDSDGSLIVSARNTWAAYKVSHRSGRVQWILGGKRSSFALGRGVAFAFQHDVRARGTGDGTITLFDDGAGPPAVHHQSRGLVLQLSSAHRTATLVRSLTHSPALLADYEGNVQLLPSGDYFLGWGQRPNFTEFTPRGRVVFDARFVDTNASYRAYRFPWTGTPRTLPRVVAVRQGSAAALAFSWNGATNVVSWRVLGGPTSSQPDYVTTTARTGFETDLTIPYRPYVAVQALDRSGRVLASSATVSPG
jgi:hypothetical protein